MNEASTVVHSAPTRPKAAWGSFSLLSKALLLTTATVAPARWHLAREQGNVAWAKGLFFAGGLLSDLASVGPLVALGLVALLATSRGHTRRPRLEGALSLAFGALLVVLALVHNSATLFRLNRGVFPGPIDAREGLAAPEFFLSELPEVLGGRFLVANLVAFAVASLVARNVHRGRIARSPTVAAWPPVFVTTVAFVGLALAARNANAYCETLHNGGAVVSPVSTWFQGLLGGQTFDGTPTSVRRLVSSFEGSADDVANGAAAMGFSAAAAARVQKAEALADCAAHPLARPLAPDETPLGEAASAVSRELFRGKNAPLVVFHVSLESVRADDIAAIEPKAPRAIAPFLTSVYEGHPSAIAFRHAHQSGIRTAHALAAVQCGVGALPFHLALGRDLGNVQLRCLPDVLHDAGYQGHVFYGHELAFDDMSTFLKYHGLTLHERGDFPKSAPRGVWGGVTDVAVYADALRAASLDSRAQYNFILTLSHHTPFTEPEDLSPGLRAEVNEVCTARDLNGENCARLRTLRYADSALSRFIEDVEASPAATRTIVIFGADHTTHQWVPWDGAEKADGVNHIPLAVWLPKALRARVEDRVAFDAALAHLRDLAASRPISNTDVPTLLLALLERGPGLRELPSASRWHTLGGQATSSAFRSPLEPSRDSGSLFGIDAHAQLFSIDASGATHPSGLAMDTLRTRNDVHAPTPTNRGMLAFWGSFLRGYGAKCTR